MSVAVVHLATTEGHFFSYGMAFVEAARRSHRRVIVLVPDLAPALTSDQRADLERFGIELQTYPSPIPRRARKPLWWVHLREWGAIQSACGSMGEKNLHLILPYLDTMFMGLLTRAPTRCVAWTLAVTMRGDIGQHRSPAGWGGRLKQGLWRRLLRMRRPDVLATNDPLLYARASSPALSGGPPGTEPCLGHRPGTGLPLAFLPDFSFCRPGATSGPERGRALVCLAVGFLDRRKHLSLLVQAIVSLRARSESSCADPIRLRLAGAIAEDALDEAGQAALATLNAQGAVEIHSGYQSDADYAEALVDADMVWVYYAGHDFASGVVLDVIASDRILLAQESGVIGYYAGRYGRSVLIPDDARIDDVANVLIRAVAECGRNREPVSAGAIRPIDRSTYVDAISYLLALAPSVAGSHHGQSVLQ